MNKTTIIQSLILTLIGMNVMIVALIIGKKMIPISISVPSIGKQVSKPQQNIEYRMDKVGADRWEENKDGQGFWRIEHYREHEYHYDENGNVIEKRPTSKEEHLRYWHDAK